MAPEKTPLMTGTATRTTLTLPGDLLDRVDRAVREGRARSRNAFVAQALERDLARAEQAAIDAAFAGMANDEDYLAESRQIDAEFAASDAEALQLAERVEWDAGRCTTPGSIPPKAPSRPGGARLCS